MNWRGVFAIYKFEMHRFRRTLWTGLAVPVKRGMWIPKLALKMLSVNKDSIISPGTMKLP